jgi:DNA mismatch repair ATPase MutS
MRVVDSLTDGKSRFLAEVSLVKHILDLADHEPVLFLFDELFSGTNSEDRRAGAAGAITHLLHRNACGFLTTHDLALSELVASRPTIAKNVHFIDHVKDGEMEFDYCLRDGLAPHTNGGIILAKLGIL